MIKVVENTFSASTLEKLKIFTRDGRQPSTTNFFNWTKNVTGMSNAIFKFDLTEDLKELVTKELIDKNILPSIPKKWNIAVQLCSRMSYIPWHNDANWIFSATVYLNNEWNPEWGGYFTYQDDNEIKAIIPSHNKAISFKTPLKHSVLLTSIDSPFREALQIFVEEF
jgi:Rps23 Pro-64 3,4-dihydroxylase Tpa1-like proline 4-hydroxylase